MPWPGRTGLSSKTTPSSRGRETPAQGWGATDQPFPAQACGRARAQGASTNVPSQPQLVPSWLQHPLGPAVAGLRGSSSCTPHWAARSLRPSRQCPDPKGSTEHAKWPAPGCGEAESAQLGGGQRGPRQRPRRLLLVHPTRHRNGEVPVGTGTPARPSWTRRTRGGWVTRPPSP